MSSTFERENKYYLIWENLWQTAKLNDETFRWTRNLSFNPATFYCNAISKALKVNCHVYVLYRCIYILNPVMNMTTIDKLVSGSMTGI